MKPAVMLAAAAAIQVGVMGSFALRAQSQNLAAVWARAVCLFPGQDEGAQGRREHAPR
jgi:hypothetical protein